MFSEKEIFEHYNSSYSTGEIKNACREILSAVSRYGTTTLEQVLEENSEEDLPFVYALHLLRKKRKIECDYDPFECIYTCHNMPIRGNNGQKE